MSALALIAQAGMAVSAAYYVKVAIVVAAVIAIGYVVLRQVGVTIPAFVIQIFWILLAVVVGLVALNFLFSMI